MAKAPTQQKQVASLTAWMASSVWLEAIPAGSLGVGKRLPDDVAEFRVHVGMKARPKPKEKPPPARAQPREAEHLKKFELSGQPNAPTSTPQNLTACASSKLHLPQKS